MRKLEKSIFVTNALFLKCLVACFFLFLNFRVSNRMTDSNTTIALGGVATNFALSTANQQTLS